MRTFVAIEIPGGIRSKIADLIALLTPSGPEIRWARPEGLHVTLKFLGEISPDKAEEVKNNLAAIHLTTSIPLRIEGCGYFPTERSPRVIWLGIQAGEGLGQLAAKVEEGLQPLGFEKETRPFSPHLTLGRLRTPGKITAVQQLLREQAPLSFGAFSANEFFLYESKPSRAGSSYTKIASFEISHGAE